MPEIVMEIVSVLCRIVCIFALVIVVIISGYFALEGETPIRRILGALVLIGIIYGTVSMVYHFLNN